MKVTYAGTLLKTNCFVFQSESYHMFCVVNLKNKEKL